VDSPDDKQPLINISGRINTKMFLISVTCPISKTLTRTTGHIN
jgi:hypothetical protein